jgi:glutathionylspermidine synthase
VILNPPYTLLFQSKGILKILWDLYPNHPLLLEASFEPLKYQKCVRKVMFGREGANIAIVSEYGTKLTTTEGDYEKQKVIYQKYTEFLKDNDGNCYQAGVFFASDGCGLGFRKGGEIIDNLAQFCGHIIV